MITVLDFYADWCGPCHAMDPILQKVAKEMGEKVTVEKVNVDLEQAKSQQFGVMSIPTLVIMKDGKEIDRRIGLLVEPVLKQWLEGHTQ